MAQVLFLCCMALNLAWISASWRPGPDRQSNPIPTADYLRQFLSSIDKHHNPDTAGHFTQTVSKIIAAYADIPEKEIYDNNSIVALAQIRLQKSLTLRPSALDIFDHEQRFMRELYNRVPLAYIKVVHIWPLDVPVAGVKDLGNALGPNTRACRLNEQFVSSTLMDSRIRQDGRTFREVLDS